MDKILSFLQDRLVGQLRYRRPQQNANKTSKTNWPVVLIVKIERSIYKIWPGDPLKQQTVNGFNVYYLEGPTLKACRFTDGHWILKHFRKVDEIY